MPKELHIFDLDGTLFEDGIRPVEGVVEKARASISDPDVATRVLTARRDFPSVVRNSTESLRKLKLDFDRVEFQKDPGPAPQHKAEVVNEWLTELPHVRRVVFYDDKAENLSAVEAVVEEAGLEYEAPMSKPKSMKDMRGKAAKKALKPSKVVKDARGRDRDYRKEYDRDHADADARKKRAMRNKARRKMGLKVGDGKEVDHKKPIASGGSNGKKNLRVVSRKTNRTRPLPKRK